MNCRVFEMQHLQRDARAAFALAVHLEPIEAWLTRSELVFRPSEHCASLAGSST
jgi:hypothetical protein